MTLKVTISNRYDNVQAREPHRASRRYYNYRIQTHIIYTKKLNDYTQPLYKDPILHACNLENKNKNKNKRTYTVQKSIKNLSYTAQTITSPTTPTRQYIMNKHTYSGNQYKWGRTGQISGPHPKILTYRTPHYTMTDPHVTPEPLPDLKIQD